MPKVAICTPTRDKPHQAFADALVASLPSLEAAGWEHAMVLEVGCPYISHARASALRKALDGGVDAVIFLDDDVSWQPDALVRLLEIPDPVVCGTYRFKREPEEYMGSVLAGPGDLPRVRASDGCIEMFHIPAGFLKVTRAGVAQFMRAYPELIFGDPCAPHVDLFNHGAHAGVWFGEDYAFARRWREKCGPVWLIPDLQIDHHSATTSYPGHFHDYLRRQPGGDLAPDAKDA